MALSILVPIIWILFEVLRRIRADAPKRVRAVKEFVVPSEGPRFRKRDKIEFMGRRVFRNAKAVGSFIRGGQGRKRKAMAKLVKKVFSRGTPEFQSQVYLPELPDEYLQEETDSVQDDGPLHGTLIPIVLKNLRVFGHIDNKIFIEVMKNICTVSLKAHDSLFKVGEHDENMYIIESGCINVFSTSRDPRTGEVQTTILKKVRSGEALFSLLSFIEHLGGRRKMYKTVSANATEDTKVIKISFNSFRESLLLRNESLSRVVQVVMVRLQRVTLLALHQYLGLGAELLSHSNRGGDKPTPMSRQSSKQHHELKAMLRKQMSFPESSELEHQSVQNEPAVYVTSPTVIVHKSEIERMNNDELKQLSVEAFQEILGLTNDDIENFASPIKDFININEPGKKNFKQK